MKTYTVLRPFPFKGNQYKPDDETCNTVQMRPSDAKGYLALKMIALLEGEDE